MLDTLGAFALCLAGIDCIARITRRSSTDFEEFDCSQAF
jgi:hypothetical protein